MKELKAILPFAKPYRWWIVAATVCMLLVTAANLTGPWLIRSLVAMVEDLAAGRGPPITAILRTWPFPLWRFI